MQVDYGWCKEIQTRRSVFSSVEEWEVVQTELSVAWTQCSGVGYTRPLKMSHTNNKEVVFLPGLALGTPDHTVTPAQASRSVSFLSLLSHPKPAVSLSFQNQSLVRAGVNRLRTVSPVIKLAVAGLGDCVWPRMALFTTRMLSTHCVLSSQSESANMTASCTANWIRQVANSYILHLLLTVVYLHTDVLSPHRGCGKLSRACRCCGPLSFGQTQNNTLTELSYQMFVMER